MAHLPDGILAAPVLAAGAALAGLGLWQGCKALTDAEITRISLLGAGFFAASLVSVPVGPSTVHLMLSGVMAMVLGRRVFAAVFVALLLQALMFGIGGLTTLGVNTFNIAAPAAGLAWATRPMMRRFVQRGQGVALAALAAGVAGVSVAGTGALVALALGLSDPLYMPLAKVMMLTYAPLAIVEAALAAALLPALLRLAPEVVR